LNYSLWNGSCFFCYQFYLGHPVWIGFYSNLYWMMTNLLLFIYMKYLFFLMSAGWLEAQNGEFSKNICSSDYFQNACFYLSLIFSLFLIVRCFNNSIQLKKLRSRWGFWVQFDIGFFDFENAKKKLFDRVFKIFMHNQRNKKIAPVKYFDPRYMTSQNCCTDLIYIYIYTIYTIYIYIWYITRCALTSATIFKRSTIHKKVEKSWNP
jgi:hypothetical protein